MKISTSILNAENRLECVKKLNRTNTSYIHIDVMDGKFVPNTQFNNIREISAINIISKYKLDIHLMVENPIEYIEQFNNMNIECITFHIEVEKDIKEIISKIKTKGYKAGLSIKPNTNIDELVPYLKDIDLILVMSVEPGKGGQEFLQNTTERINKVKKLITKENDDIQIEVDGGINDETITLLENVDIAVVGSYIIKSDNYYQTIEKLLKIHKNNSSVTSDDTKYNPKKIIIYKILLGVGIFPFILFLSVGVYSMIFGYSGLCFISCTQYYGWNAFRDSIVVFGFIYWPILLIGLILIIISTYKLEKEKNKN